MNFAPNYFNLESLVKFTILKVSAHLRLQNSKRTSKRQVSSSIVPEKPEGGPNWRAKRWSPLRLLNIHCCKMSKKIERGPFRDILKFSKKKTKNENFEQSRSAEKCFKGFFSTSILLQDTKK